MAKINPIMQAIRETTPPEVSKQVDIAVRISNRIYELLEEKAMSQKDLAQKLGKTETELKHRFHRVLYFDVKEFPFLGVSGQGQFYICTIPEGLL